MPGCVSVSHILFEHSEFSSAASYLTISQKSPLLFFLVGNYLNNPVWMHTQRSAPPFQGGLFFSCHEYQRAIFTCYDYPTKAKSLLTLFSWYEYLLTLGMGELFVSQTGVWETGKEDLSVSACAETPLQRRG